MSRTTKQTLAIMAAAAVVTLIVAYIMFAVPADERYSGNRDSLGAPTSGADAYVTMSEFRRAQPGMTYREVEEIVGFPGEISSQSRFGDLETTMYVWSNGDLSSMSAVFQNGELSSKTQVNLR